MNTRGRLFLAILVVCMLVNVILPGVNAEIFDIGEKVENDLEPFQFYSFTSKTYMRAGEHEVNVSSLIFDGNLSTGIDQNISDNQLNFRLEFIYPLYVNNITIKPSFGNGSSNYSLSILIHSTTTIQWSDMSGERVFIVNGFINGINFRIFPNGTDQFYFNDVLINYTPFPTCSECFLEQLNNVTQQIDILNNMIDELNQTVNGLNETQQHISENITDLWSTYNQLDNSITNIIDQIDNLESTTDENITLIKNDLLLIKSDLNDIFQSLDNLTTNATQISDIQDLINLANQDIYYLNENITEIKSSQPSEYNDTTLSNWVIQLESENSAMSTEIENLKTEMEEIKDSQDEPDNYPAFIGISLGILGIIIAIVAVILASRKLGEKTPPGEEKEPAEEDDKASEEDY